MRQLVADHVERGREVSDVDGEVRRKAFAEHHRAAGALAAPERVQIERADDLVIVDVLKDVGTRHRMHDRANRPIVVVEAAAAEALEEVVVGPAEIHVRVDDRRIRPVVVGVAGDVALRRVDEPFENVDRASQIAAHVERDNRRRPQPVVGEIAAADAVDADLLFIAERAAAAADGGLGLDVRDALDFGAGLRVDEQAEDVAARRDVRPATPARTARRRPRAAARAVRARDPAAADRRSARRRGRAPARSRRGRGVDRDVRMDRAEDGDGLRAVALAHQLRAEDARRAVVLIEAIVGAAVHHRVGPALGEAQRAGVGESPDLGDPSRAPRCGSWAKCAPDAPRPDRGRGRHRDQRETERPASKRPRHERERTPPHESCMELHA